MLLDSNKNDYGWWVSRDGAKMNYWGGAPREVKSVHVESASLVRHQDILVTVMRMKMCGEKTAGF